MLQRTDQPLTTDVVLPARQAHDTLPAVIAGIPTRLVRSVVVVDRGSSDATAQVARDAGAVVLRESHGGYGTACRRAVAHLERLPAPPDVVVFCAADGSDDSSQLGELLLPIQHDHAELVLGVRGGGKKARPLRAKVATSLIGVVYRHRFEDVGPFRAVRFPALVAMGLNDSGEGFHVEMQVKAIKLGLKIAEVPVRHRPVDQREPVLHKARQTTHMLLQIVRHSTAR